VKPPASQRGVALLIALLIAALAGIIAVQITRRAELDLARSAALARGLTAGEYARGLEALARSRLRDDLLAGDDVDASDDPWGQPLPPLPVPGGAVSGAMIDLDGRFNANSLLHPDGTPDPEARALFERLLDILELEPAIAAQALDWIDADTISSENGAEDAAYRGRTPPYLPANRLFSHPSELRLLALMDEATWRQLEPHVTVLPANARRINVNTASLEVLMALDPALDRERARALYQNGHARYRTVADFLKAPALDGLALPELAARIAVTSRYFLASAEVRLDRTPRRYYFLLAREGGRIDTLYRSQGRP